MPTHQGIRSNKGTEVQQGFPPYHLRLPRKQRPLSICEPNALTAHSLLEQAILDLEELNDGELTAVDPARDGHQ